MKKIIFILILLFQNAYATEVSPVVRDIENSFKKIETIQTHFDQTVSSTRFDAKKSSGTLTLQRPGKMIWKYEQPKGRVFAADGNTITLFDPEDQQALVSIQPKGSDLPAGFAFLMGHGDLTKFFNVEVLRDGNNTQGHREVKLLCQPKKTDIEFKTLELTFEWNPDLQLTDTKTVDMMDSENHIAFKNMKTNVKVSSKEFTVQLPKNTPIVTVDSIRP